MQSNMIPGIDHGTGGGENIRLVIGLAVYVIALGGLVAYLVWKLPRRGEDEMPGTEAEKDEEAAREE